MKNDYAANTKNYRKKWHCFTFPQISLMSSLTKNCCSFISGSAFNLLGHVILVENIKKIWLCKDIYLKKGVF